MICGLPGNSFVFMEFEEGGGVFEVSALALGAVGLNFAELVQGPLELAGESLDVKAEGGEGAVGGDRGDVLWSLLGGGAWAWAAVAICVQLGQRIPREGWR